MGCLLVGGGGSPDLTDASNKGAGFLWICDVAGTAYPNGVQHKST